MIVPNSIVAPTHFHSFLSQSMRIHMNYAYKISIFSLQLLKVHSRLYIYIETYDTRIHENRIFSIATEVS